MIKVLVAMLILAAPAVGMGNKAENTKTKEAIVADSFYDFSMKTIDGKDKSLADYRGRPVLVVNVASECGNTPQYEGLQDLYMKYKDRGLAVVGFPANEFGKQEPGSDEQIKEFCKVNYGVTFDMYSKIVVKGEGIHPLYQWLTSQKGFEGDIDWNFAKFLINKNGHVFARFKAGTKPESGNVIKAVEEALAQP